MFGCKKKAVGKRLSLFSPAKINAFFRVLHKREDGFHEIASLYQAISLGDFLHIIVSDQDSFSCTDLSLLGETNLVHRALELFRKKTGCSLFFNIYLEKNIPVQAGLGGGSSNAATALFGFCILAGLSISSQELMSWGAELGSDVPFFFSLGTAYAEGRGEVLQEVKPLVLPSFWIAKPDFGLSTAQVYEHCTPAYLPVRDPMQNLLDFSSGTKSFYNDLEGAAFALSPSLGEIKKHLLRSGFETVTLSGSGTAFFCFGSVVDRTFLQQLSGLQLFPVTTLNRKEHSWYKLG